MPDEKIREYLRAHKAVKNSVERNTVKKACGCVSVNDIANELSVEPGTVKVHLDLMTIDGVGKYLDNNEKMFCTREGIKRLAKGFGLIQSGREGSSKED